MELFAALFEVLDEAGVPQQTMRQVGERMKQLAQPGSAASRQATHILAPTAAPAATARPAPADDEPSAFPLEE